MFFAIYRRCLQEEFKIKASWKRKLYPSCAKCGENYKGACLWGFNVCYRCGDKGHKQKNCPVATRLGNEGKLKEVWIKEGLSLDGIMVPNERVSMIFQEYHCTSSGKCKFYSFIVEVGKIVFIFDTACLTC